MRYMIHACPQRMWYVEDFLIPSMKKQGIGDSEIIVWNDTKQFGNLYSCMEAFKECEKYDGHTWHLQDDVLICRDFAKRTKEAIEFDIVCGFVCKEFESKVDNWGDHRVAQMWYSFQCIKIPNKYAGECANWFFNDASKREEMKYQVSSKKMDDWFWYTFLKENHPHDKALNLRPNLVDHVDYLIGGTIVNKDRTHKESRAYYFEDKDLVAELEEELKRRAR